MKTLWSSATASDELLGDLPFLNTQSANILRAKLGGTTTVNPIRILTKKWQAIIPLLDRLAAGGVTSVQRAIPALPHVLDWKEGSQEVENVPRTR